ncbi:MAG: LPS export ABC transporter permease LptF [Rhodobacteraceae bacterium]|nr:LPS export ABC transporter permease LptF [Paracoccaceae bacterium]
MSRFDRYVLSQLLLFFGFFALILVAVFWINRAVVLFDRLIGDGQSALVFLEFSALALPNLIRMVLPMAAFAAAVYVTNRLNRESELVILQATGSSPWQLARPALVFGLITALMMSILTHVLMPASVNQLAEREAEITRNMTARLLTEGTFLHPTKGVTFYIRKIDADGTLRNVFLSDRRKPGQSKVFTAAEAFLVRNDGQSSLIMVNGLAQQFSNETRTLATTVFEDFSYDITSLVHSDDIRARNIRGISTLELLGDRQFLAETEKYSYEQLTEELHLRFARALICVAVALIGFSTLMLGGFSRFGVWRQVLLAFFILIFLEVLRGVVAKPVLQNADIWPLIYLPSLVGLSISMLFLHIAARPRQRLWPRRAPQKSEASA